VTILFFQPAFDSRAAAHAEAMTLHVSVIPAQAGIQAVAGSTCIRFLDFCLRRRDDPVSLQAAVHGAA